MSFSERFGLVPTRALQRGEMDGPLRNGLWNAVDALVQRMDVSGLAFSRIAQGAPSPGGEFLEHLWVEFLGAARDQFGNGDPLSWFRQWFYEAPWNRAYDFIEYVAALVCDQRFEDDCNHALTRERAAYRLVQSHVIELADEGQLDAIGRAVENTAGVPGVHEHLRTALARLADRPDPDCRNAIKEAISAVEALAKQMVGASSGTLADALKSFEKRGIPLHPALNRAWQTIYGYTSDEGGVRHALKGDSEVAQAEAIYMLVSCSAFVNYMMEIARRAGIELGPKK